VTLERTEEFSITSFVAIISFEALPMSQVVQPKALARLLGEKRNLPRRGVSGGGESGG
jgi:hypothetical protein